MSRGSNKGAIRQMRRWWRVTEVRAGPCSLGLLPVPAAHPALLAFPSPLSGGKQSKTSPCMGWCLETPRAPMGPPALGQPWLLTGPRAQWRRVLWPGAAGERGTSLREPWVRPRLPQNSAHGPAACWPLPALFTLQWVTMLGSYLNYPSALIRQSGERRGRQAERERSRLELSAHGQLTAAGLARASGGGVRKRKVEKGVPLPLWCPPEGCLWVGLCKAGPLGGLLLQENSWHTGMGFHASSWS